ncbi:hypothetical protein IED13_25795 [Bosea sp. SSUT16]|uniref:Uncharacterized protein n=1 Tax=Bosea spartocytisi TaxID=2773451 RepID=A0A927EEU1_9HYPH|nr:hypothetical protein [Bosea spartocytisi]MBD3849127.1 hypothetical protein [Bosea spartocytisi]
MPKGKDRGLPSLETQAVAAHRAYLDALVSWDAALHMATCPICRPEGWSEAEGSRRCDTAEIEKERCRRLFRDLCDDLGYVPSGHGLALPDEKRSCRQADKPDQSTDIALDHPSKETTRTIARGPKTDQASES